MNSLEILNAIDERAHDNIKFADGKAKFFLAFNIVWLISTASDSDIAKTVRPGPMSYCFAILAAIFCFAVAYPRGGGNKTAIISIFDAGTNLIVALVNKYKSVISHLFKTQYLVSTLCAAIAVLLMLIVFQYIYLTASFYAKHSTALEIAIGLSIGLTFIFILILSYLNPINLIDQGCGDSKKPISSRAYQEFIQSFDTNTKKDCIDPVKIALHEDYLEFQREYYKNISWNMLKFSDHDGCGIENIRINNSYLKMVYNRCCTNADKYRSLILGIQCTLISWAFMLPKAIDYFFSQIVNF